MMKQRSMVMNVGLMLAMAASSPAWSIEIIEDYQPNQQNSKEKTDHPLFKSEGNIIEIVEDYQTNQKIGKKEVNPLLSPSETDVDEFSDFELMGVENREKNDNTSFHDLVAIDETKGFKIPSYVSLDWEKNGDNIKKEGLIFDENLSLHYQVILPQDFLLANDVVGLGLSHFTDFLPSKMDLTTYLKQQPQVIAQHFYNKIDGSQQYSVVVYRLFTQDHGQERYIHMLMAKNLLPEDLKLFENLRQRLTVAFLAKRGEVSFCTEPYQLTKDLPALTPTELRCKLTEWLIDKSPFQVIPSETRYVGGNEVAPMFWRLRWGGEEIGEVIVTAPINDLSGEDDEMIRAAKGNLIFSEVWGVLKKEIKEFDNIATILLPLGQTETIMGKNSGAHWNLLEFRPHDGSWDVIKYDPKSSWNGLLYTQAELEGLLRKHVRGIKTFHSKFLGHQDLMNTTNCGYFILSYMQFLTHGMALIELDPLGVINQFPMWIEQRS